MNRLPFEGRWPCAKAIDHRFCGPCSVSECEPASKNPVDFILAAQRAIDLYEATRSPVIIALPWLSDNPFVIVDETRKTVADCWRRLCEITEYLQRTE